MARRGALTALQAVLAGVSGGAQGYVQQQELERKRQQERAAQERQQAMDLITFGERAIEPGSLATRAPMGAPRAEAPRTALPPSAVSLPTGPVDFGGAMRQLEQEEARPSGTTPLRIGDITLNIPIGQRARDIKRSEALLAERDLLTAAVQRAETEGAIKTRQEREAEAEGNRSAFEELRALGEERGEFQPNRRYADRLANYYKMREITAQRAMTPYQQEQLSLERRRLDIAEGKAKDLPVAARNSLSRLDASVLMTQNIDALIQQNPDALGGVKNFLPAQATNRIDPAGVEVRAAVEALSGEIRNLRFGGQLTGGELSQAMTMLPDRQDEPAAALAKLRQLSQFLEQKRQGVYNAFGGVYTPLGSTGSTTGTTGGATTGGRTTTTRGEKPNNADDYNG